MKFLGLSIILILNFSVSISQINYEKGYFINNENQKFEVLINNLDWKNNPIDFLFKQEEKGSPEKKNISAVKEFGLYGISRYLRSEVKIDRSSDEVTRLKYEKDPLWVEEKLFLKEVIHGKASLYYYEEGNLQRFFYSIPDSSIKQLIFKKYLVGNFIAYNNKFRQQLWLEVKCANTSMAAVEQLQYTTKHLVNYFINYNKCNGDTISISKIKTTNKFYNLKLATGIDRSEMVLENDYSKIKEFAFNKNYSIRIGVESEFILPYNKNKWRITFEPTFQYINVEKDFTINYIDLKYSSIELPIGLRYYMYLNAKTRLFINGSFIPNYTLSFTNTITFDDSVKFDITPRNSLTYGAGFDFNRINFEVRRYTNRNILGDYLYWRTDYTRVAFIFGYKIVQSTTEKLNQKQRKGREKSST